MLSVVLALSLCGTGPTVDFNLRDATGRSYRLADWREAPVVVVVFVGVDCPLAKLYAPRLVELHDRFKARGVVFVAVASNQHDAPGDLVKYARRHSLPFPVLKDTANVVADRFGAERTPEAFVLDSKRRVRYRGRIDDQYAVGLHRAKAEQTELADAVEALLAGRPVVVPVTTAPGCPISRVDRPAKRPPSVSYCKDVAPILQRRCQVCHRPGQAGPFALTSYDDAASWAQAIREVVEQGRMPPWGADPKHGKFANDPSLTPGEKDALFRWIAGGCPEGDRRDLPPPATFPPGWKIPGHNVVLAMAEPFTVPAQGTIEYQYIRVDPGFKKDVWVKAAEVMPGNPAVVHHCNVFLQPPGVDDPRQLSEQGALGSYCLTMVAPGTPPMVLPDGMAKRIPAGWQIVFVMHYQAVGSVQKDQTRLALTFADPSTVRREVATKLLFDPDLRIPPRSGDHQVTKTWQADRDVLLLSLFPHMHLRGKSFRYELLHPDGREEVLLDVPRWDFNWQHRYVLAEPLLVRAGGRLRCTAAYDNSADNPANPDPDAEVRAGVQSWEEMFNGYFDIAPAQEERPGGRPGAWRGFALVACLFGGLFLCRQRIARVLAPPKG